MTQGKIELDDNFYNQKARIRGAGVKKFRDKHYRDNMILISVYLPPKLLEAMDEITKFYPSRSEFIRVAISNQIDRDINKLKLLNKKGS